MLAAFEAGRTNRSGAEMRIALSPQLLAVSWGSHRPGVALLSLLKVLRTFLPLLTEPKADHLGSCKTIQMQTKMLLKTVP